MPTPPATSSTLPRLRRDAVIAPYGPSAHTLVPGVSSRRASLWSPIALTVIRSSSGRGAADSEYGCELNRIPGARNRHRKNCPASAPIRCSLRPPISTDTMPGVSSMTASTYSR